MTPPLKNPGYAPGLPVGNDLFGYNFDIDDGAESKLGKHKEVIAL